MIRAFKSKDFGSDSNEDHLKRKDLLLSIHGVFQGEGNGLVDNQLDIEEYKVHIASVKGCCTMWV